MANSSATPPTSWRAATCASWWTQSTSRTRCRTCASCRRGGSIAWTSSASTSAATGRACGGGLR
jgi:hypothetical protein